MKRYFSIILFFVAIQIMAQKPVSGTFMGQWVPQYCSSGDTGRLPIYFKAMMTGLVPGKSYKYFVSVITINDTATTTDGAGYPIFFKSNGKIQYSTNPGFSNEHDTILVDNAGTFTRWFGVVSNTNSRFTAGKYVYPMIVMQEITGGSPPTERYYIGDSIKVLELKKGNGSNAGTGIYGKSFATPKNVILMYDTELGGGPRPITISVAENDNTTIANMPWYYTKNANGVNGAWASIIPSNSSDGIKCIEQRNISNDVLVYANKSSNGVWGSDSTTKQYGGTIKPVYIKSDYAPLVQPVVEVDNVVINTNEDAKILPVVIRRKYGNRDTNVVSFNVVAGSATANSDYQIITSSPISMKPFGEKTDTIKVSILDNDNRYVNMEDVAIKLTNATKASIGLKTTTTVNIYSNDTFKMSFVNTQLVVNEDDGSAQIVVNSAKGPAFQTSVRIAVKSKSDSTFIPQEFKIGGNNKDTLMYFNGNYSTTLNLPLIDDNLIEKFNDTVVLVLRSPTAPGLITKDSLFTLVIKDNDAPSTFSFDKSKITVNENQASVKLRINRLTKSKNASDIAVRFISGASTATQGSDFTYSPTTQLFTINPTDPDSLIITIPIIDNFVYENTETALFTIAPFSNASIVNPDSLWLYILDNDIAEYTISKITSVKPNGVADSINTTCRIRGVVHGINTKPTGTPNPGYQFTLIDGNAGIQVYSDNGNNSYTVTEGDSIAVIGTVKQFEGLTRFENVQSIVKLASNKALKTPLKVFNVNESHESKMIKVYTFSLLNPAQWPTAPLAPKTHALVQLKGQNDTVTALIDAESDIDGTPVPSAFFNMTGIGYQIDPTSPYTSNYYIMPRRLSDIENLTVPTFRFSPITSTGNESHDSSNVFSLIADNITSNQQVTIEIKGGTATRNLDYLSNTTRTFLFSPSKTKHDIKVKMLDDNKPELEETIIWVIRGNDYGTLIGADSIHTIRIIDNETVGTKYIQLTENTNVYPNPTKDKCFITSSAPILSVKIIDITGKQINFEIPSGDKEIQLDISELQNGIYTLQIYTNEGVVNKSIQVLK